MLFVLDAIAQLGLTLNAYDSCNMQDKEWYTKDSAHFDITGSMQKLMTFLETIKNSHFMITVSQLIITRNADDVFKMNFDIGLVTVKK
jgi:Tfp pilus assembly protein PilO